MSLSALIPSQPLGKNLSFLEDPRTFEGRVSARGLRRFRKAHLENILPRGSWDRDPRYPTGVPRDQKKFWKKFLWKDIWVYVGRFRGYYSKRVIFRPKTVILKCLCYHSLIYSFFGQKSLFTTIILKPAYIYPNNFPRENFSNKIFGPLGPPWGTRGPYLGIPSVEYFPDVLF